MPSLLKLAPTMNGLYQDIPEQSDHITVQNLQTVNCWSSGILAKNSSNIIITNNEILNSGHSSPKVAIHECISLIRSRNSEISNNHVEKCGKESIDVKRGSRNVNVFGNHVHNGERAGIYIDGFDKGVQNIKVYNNLSHDFPWFASGLASEQGGFNRKIEFYNNIGTRTDRCFVLAAWDNDERARPAEDHPMDDIKFINNTCYKNKKGIRIANFVATNVIIRNNIASQNSKFQISVAPGSTAKIDYNLIDGFRNHPQEVRGSNFVEGNPRFLNAANDNYRLKEKSPAIDSGIATFAPQNDFVGTPRPRGDGFDLGAFEK